MASSCGTFILTCSCVFLCVCVLDPSLIMRRYTFMCLRAHCTYVFLCPCGRLHVCVHVLNAVTSAVTKETPWRGEEVPKGVRHGEERHVVHSLSLEKSLPEIHRLIRSPSRVCEMGSSSLGVTARWTLPLRSYRGRFLHDWSSQCCFPEPSRGSAFSLFRFQTQQENKTGA